MKTFCVIRDIILQLNPDDSRSLPTHISAVADMETHQNDTRHFQNIYQIIFQSLIGNRQKGRPDSPTLSKWENTWQTAVKNMTLLTLPQQEPRITVVRVKDLPANNILQLSSSTSAVWFAWLPNGTCKQAALFGCCKRNSCGSSQRPPWRVRFGCFYPWPRGSTQCGQTQPVILE